jgi:hypothetical protein
MFGIVKAAGRQFRRRRHGRVSRCWRAHGWTGSLKGRSGVLHCAAKTLEWAGAVLGDPGSHPDGYSSLVYPQPAGYDAADRISERHGGGYRGCRREVETFGLDTGHCAHATMSAEVVHTVASREIKEQ